MIQAGAKIPLNRCRIVIVGQGRAGKTSLVNGITGRRENKPGELSTQGVSTDECNLETANLKLDEKWTAAEDKTNLLASAILRYNALSNTKPEDDEFNPPVEVCL